MRYERFGMILLLALVWTGAASGVLSEGIGYVFGWMSKISTAVFYAVNGL